MPPLEHPTSPVLPAGVFTAMVKLPGPEIMEDVIVTVNSVLFTTTVGIVVPLKTTTEAATKWLPVALSRKVGGIFENTTELGEIEERIGAGRALPHSGFNELHPGRSRKPISKVISRQPARPIRPKEGIGLVYAETTSLTVNHSAYDWVLRRPVVWFPPEQPAKDDLATVKERQ